MNKQMLTGLVGGIAIATAGGVAAYSFLARPAAPVEQAAPAAAAPAAQDAAAVQPAPQPRPAPSRAVVQTSAPARAEPEPDPVASAPAAAPAQRCWDEEVTVQAEPKDEKAIAGTAAGAVIGGALAKKLGDDNDLVTAAGAAAGAFAGRKAQRRVQENNTTTRTERRCEPVE